MIVSGLEINSAWVQNCFFGFFFNQNYILPLNEDNTFLPLKGSLQSRRVRPVNKSLSHLIFPLTSRALKRSGRFPTVASNFLQELVTNFSWIRTSYHLLCIHPDPACRSPLVSLYSPSLRTHASGPEFII